MDDEQPPAERPNDASRGRNSSRPSVAGTRGIGRGITTAAVVVAAVAAAAAVGLVSGLLTLFGWGAAIAVGLVIVGVAAAFRPHPANGWLLVPVLALAIPAVAVAISGVRVMPQRDTVVASPTRAAEIPKDGYRAGFGDLLVDLRSLVADTGERIVVRAGSDLGRTVVALPRKRCFNLEVRWQTGRLRLPRVRERATVPGYGSEYPLEMVGMWGPSYRRKNAVTQGRIAIFGLAHSEQQGHWVAAASDAEAPTLSIELRSEGGSFVVRDYPKDVSPLRTTDWPIGEVPPVVSTFLTNRHLAVELRRAQRDPNYRSWLLAGNPIPPAIQNRIRAFLAGTTKSHAGFDRNGRLAAATARGAAKLQKEAFRHSKVAAQQWARRVSGTCNQPGAFR